MNDLITNLIDIHRHAIADDGPPTYPRERRAMAEVLRRIAEEVWLRGREYEGIFNWLLAEADKAEAGE